MDPKERLIAAAYRLFYTQGYNNTGINQIIREANVAKASFYDHFPSKEHLLIAYLEFAAGNTNKELQSEVNKAGTEKAKVLAVFDYLLKQGKLTRYNGCNFLNVLAELPQGNMQVRKAIKAQKEHVRQLFRQILSRRDKERLADELYLLFDAALSSSKVYTDKWPIEASKELANKLL